MIAVAASFKPHAMSLSKPALMIAFLRQDEPNHFSVFIALATPGITFGNPLHSSLSFV
jgi:hypothetical protein